MLEEPDGGSLYLLLSLVEFGVLIAIVVGFEQKRHEYLDDSVAKDVLSQSNIILEQLSPKLSLILAQVQANLVLPSLQQLAFEP